MENQDNNPNKRQDKGRELIVNYIVSRVEKGTGLSIIALKEKYSEESLFCESLKHVTTTKKALCKALNINIDNACRYKRNFEALGSLVQSVDRGYCPYTGFLAHSISMNPEEFEYLQKSKRNQLNLFN